MSAKAKPQGGLAAYLDGTGQLPEDVLLGHMTFFRIGDGAYDRSLIEQEMDRLDLNTSYLPPPNKEIDAYKKATTAVTDRTYQITQGEVATLLVRDTYSDATVLHRSLVREVRDPAGKRLVYGQVGEAVFYRPTITGGKVVAGSARMKVTLHGGQLRPSEDAPLRELIREIEAGYNRHCDFIDGQKVRGLIRTYLGHLNAVALKDSVYFVHVSRREEMAKLRDLVTFLDTQAKYGCKMQLIPLVDLDEQRDMVIEAYQDEAEKSLQEIVSDIQGLRSTRGKITQAAYIKVKERFNQVTRETAEYATKLDVTADRVAGAAEIAMEAIAELQKRYIADNNL